MATTMTLNDFYNWVRDNRKRISDIYREIEEIQNQFNGLHARQAEERRKHIGDNASLLLSGPNDLPPELARLLSAQEQAEHQRIQAEMERLQADERDKREKADALVVDAQQQLAHLREQNPILNQQEEALKARRAVIQKEVQGLDEEINRLSKFPFGRLTNVARIHKLDQRRAQLADNVGQMTEGIRTVRTTWQDEKKKLQESQSNLQGQWQSLSVEAAQTRARLDYMATSIDQESKRSATQNLLGNLEQLPAVEGSWKDRLTPLIELNVKNKEFEAGLRAVAEMLGLLKGLGEGMDRFIRSVGTVYEEQHRYKLPSLTFELSDAVTSFHAAWSDIESKVKDEKYLGSHPLEFSQRITGFMEQRLSDAAIQRMFEDMGSALNQATKAWH